MNDPNKWREGDTWTNERGVTFRLQRDPSVAALVWVKQHFQLPSMVALELAPCR